MGEEVCFNLSNSSDKEKDKKKDDSMYTARDTGGSRTNRIGKP